jgi:site-specific recombinase XerD
VMRTVGDSPEGLRLRALVVILWRAGLRISKALALAESDLDSARGAVLVRRGKGGRRREVGMTDEAGSSCDPHRPRRVSINVVSEPGQIDGDHAVLGG